MSRRKDQWLAGSAFVLGAAMTLLAATSANAADLAGKWYGELDSDPVISISKAGPDYSASLGQADITKSVTGAGIRVFHESIHRELVSFKVVGSNVRFSIRNTVSVNGDLNYERDTYNLDLSEDGGQMTGSVTQIVYVQGPDKVQTTMIPITLFSSDRNSRAPKAQP